MKTYDHDDYLVEILPSSALQATKDAPKFVTDQWLADQLEMKVPTIRSQRYKRRHGLQHWLTIDAVMIGASPRYRLTEALEWLASR